MEFGMSPANSLAQIVAASCKYFDFLWIWKKITNTIYPVSQKKITLFVMNFLEFYELLKNESFCIWKSLMNLNFIKFGH